LRAVLCRAYGPPESLVMEDAPPPVPAKGQVRIKVHAAGLNFADTLMVGGTYQVKPPFPFSPGLECAGTVAEVGADARRFAVGDRVMAVTSWGAMAEEAVAEEAKVFRIPESMSFAEAAAFPVAYGTVAHGLLDRGRLQPGETLVVHGAGGGVGLCAVEVGALLGAKVIATAGGAEKLKLARDHGAAHGINYATESIRDRVKELTDGKGADVIFDAVGGDAFDQSMRCIAWDGRLLVVGFASGRIPSAPANLILVKGISVIGVFWGDFAMRDPARSRAHFERMFDWYRAGKLKPHVSATFPLDQTAAAMQAMLSRRTTGKVVIAVRPD
jgi:NADPH:quinone reductase